MDLRKLCSHSLTLSYIVVLSLYSYIRFFIAKILLFLIPICYGIGSNSQGLRQEIGEFPQSKEPVSWRVVFSKVRCNLLKSLSSAGLHIKSGDMVKVIAL